jgi:hypothetical protein
LSPWNLSIGFIRSINLRFRSTREWIGSKKISRATKPCHRAQPQELSTYLGGSRARGELFEEKRQGKLGKVWRGSETIPEADLQVL